LVDQILKSKGFSMRLFLASAFLLGFTTAATAQSVVTLDSFDLDDSSGSTGKKTAPSGVTGQSEEMRDCLFSTSGCADSEFESGVDISLDDVFNLGVIDRGEVAGSVAIGVVDRDPLPSIDLEILFAYDSDQLSPEAMRTLADLSTALNDPRLASARLVFIGHTDAVGSETYNLDLSRRRAESVARFVMSSLAIPPGQVESVGVGFTRLKNTFDPSAAENRRVQLVLVPGV